MAYTWTPDDYKALADAAATIQAKPEDLLLVLYSESRLNPAAYNPAGAYGLNQLTRAAGFTQAELSAVLQLTPREQMPYVVRYFKATGRTTPFEDAGAVYAFNFAPSVARAKGTGSGVVLYSKASGAAYELNKGLDFDKNGDISVGDLRRHLSLLASQQSFRDAKKAMDDALAVPTQPPGPYTVLDISYTSTPDLSNKLNAEYQKGWKLVAAIGPNRFVFEKR